MPWRNCCTPPAIEATKAAAMSPEVLIALVVSGFAPVAYAAKRVVRRSR